MEEKDERGQKKEYKKFRELLKKGMKDRTQADFAQSVGITRQYLNRLLKEPVISRPSITTLKSMAKSLSGVTYKELMTSCGYETRDIHEIADTLADDLKLFFTDSTSPSHISHLSLEELCDLFKEIFCPPEISEMRCVVKSDLINSDQRFSDADQDALIEITWGDDIHICTTSCHLYYAVTRSGAHVMVGFHLEKTDDDETAVIMYRHPETYSAEARLLTTIFGPRTGIYFPTFYMGYGLPYKVSPQNFKAFLSNHQATFCINEDLTALWKRVVVDDEGTDVVFKNFESPDRIAIFDKNSGVGPGAVISTIMTDELRRESFMHDYSFVYYMPDIKLPEAERTSCILLSERTMDSISRQLITVPVSVLTPKDLYALLDRLYFYAEELGIDHFGQCYHRYAAEIDDSAYWSTNQYRRLVAARDAEK